MPRDREVDVERVRQILTGMVKDGVLKPMTMNLIMSELESDKPKAIEEK